MMNLLSRSWSLLHMSLAMTPKHSETSVENSARRSDKAEHSKSMCPLIAQCPGVAKPANEAMARQTQVAALFNRFFRVWARCVQGQKLIVSRLCTLKKRGRKHETARKLRNLRVGKRFGQGQK